MLIDYVKLRLRLRKALRSGDPELQELGRLIRPGSVAMDVGANRGVYAMAMSRHASRVVAFEPFSLSARRLRDARVPRLVIHEIALSNKNGEAEIAVPYKKRGQLNHPSASLTQASGHQQTPSTSRMHRESVVLGKLDDYAEPELNLIKIDVEGHEDQVLDGAQVTLAELRPRLLVEMEERISPGILKRIPEKLVKHGYVCRFLDGGQWYPLETLRQGQRGPTGRYINNFLFEVEPRHESQE